MEELTLWILRAREGDLEAWDWLYQRFEASLFRLAYHMLQDEEEAADVVQETFLRAFQQRQRLQAPEAFSQWLRTIAMNCCRRRYRRRSQSPPLLSLEALGTGEEGEGQEIASEAPSPEEEMERGELRQKLREALGQLPPEQREVIVLHHLEGMAVEDIARLLKCPVGTVKSRLGRGRQRLKELLQDYMGG